MALGYQIIKQPNKLYCLYSSNIDTLVLINATKEDIIDFMLEREKEMIEFKVSRKIEKIEKGEKAYHQFTLTFDEMLEDVERVEGKSKMLELKRLMQSEPTKNK